jgi:hypothetical protein
MIAPKKSHYRNLRVRQQLMFSKLHSLVSKINFKLYIKYIQNSMLNKAAPFSIGIIAIVACTSSLRRAIIMPKTLKRGPCVGRHHKKANTKKTSSEVEGSLSGAVESRANKKGRGAAEDETSPSTKSLKSTPVTFSAMRRDAASSTVVLPPSAECEKPASMDATPPRPSESTSAPGMSMYKKNQIKKAKLINVDQNAFETKKGGEKRSSVEAGKRAKRRKTLSLMEYIQSIGNESQQVLTMQALLAHPKMASFARTIGYVQPEDVEVALFQYQQQQEAIAIAASTDNPRGRPTDDERSFIRSVGIASAPGSQSTDVPKSSSLVKQFLGAVSRRTGYRYVKQFAKE